MKRGQSQCFRSPRFTNRGQAALEFLTTYGWAFLVILVMIGAITYFGILNPSKFLPARCTVSPEFSCMDYKIDTTGRVSLQFQQGIGKTIYFTNLTCYYEGTPFTDPSPIPNPSVGSSWSPRNTLSLSCTNGTIGFLAGRKAKVSFDINYQTSPIGLNHTASGEVYAQVQ